MPVRVKQRASMIEGRGEQERQWEFLKRVITGLLLAWQDQITLRLRDAENSRTLVLNANRKHPISLEEKLPSNGRKVHAALRPLIATLSQASYITPDEWSSWVPASASTSSVSIKGAISMEPAPTKSVQFLSVGIKPIFSDDGHNELFEEVNRLFGNSSFGVVEDESELDEREKERRLHDKRYKTDGPTNKQLRGGKKGIDRWPKFCLRIQVADAKGNEEKILESESRLQSIMEVLRAMITQWLQVHHFRPRIRQSRRVGSRPESVSSRASTPALQERDELEQLTGLRDSAGETSEPMPPKGQKRKRSSGHTTHANHGMTPREAPVLSDWSRIKSGKSAFYENIWSSKKPPADQPKPQTAAATVSETGPARASSDGVGGASTFFQSKSIMPGEFGRLRASSANSVQSVDFPEDQHQSNSDETNSGPATGSNQGGSMQWTDPNTKETYRINTRTGTVITQDVRQLKSARSGSSRASASIAAAFNKPLRLSRKPGSAPGSSGGKKWLTDFLADWDNPVFHPQTSAIPQVNLHGFSSEANGLFHGRSGHCSYANIKQAFDEASLLGENKLSKQALGKSRVVAQVDKKFILAVMEATSPAAATNSACATTQPNKRLLVIIDQHAADERCRVEELFAELCLPNPAPEECRSNLDHVSRIKTSVLADDDAMYLEIASAQEARLLELYAGSFAAWGIIYDLNKSGARHILTVKALPPGVSERCLADPKLLLALLRSEVWKLAEGGSIKRSSSTNELEEGSRVVGSSTEAAEPHSSSWWLAGLGSCPRGILELLHSRACRSAVMFNDALSGPACVELVGRLAHCAFPFQCAHGRPSMVPLVDLGTTTEVGLGRGDEEEDVLGVFGRGRTEEKSGFVEAFKRWRQADGAQNTAKY